MMQLAAISPNSSTLYVVIYDSQPVNSAMDLLKSHLLIALKSTRHDWMLELLGHNCMAGGERKSPDSIWENYHIHEADFDSLLEIYSQSMGCLVGYIARECVWGQEFPGARNLIVSRKSSVPDSAQIELKVTEEHIVGEISFFILPDQTTSYAIIYGSPDLINKLCQQYCTSDDLRNYCVDEWLTPYGVRVS